MRVRTNSTKRALQAKQRVIYVQPHFPSPELVEFLGRLGFDGVFLDAEHGGLELVRAQELIRAADCCGTSTLVRVPRNEPATILSYLDLGALGVLVPHIQTPAEAVAAVQSAKFAPQGNRGAHAATRAADYGLYGTAAAYFERANRETLVAAMIEDVLALDNLEAIIRTPGLDLCVLGREDLAMALGHPGTPDHPDVWKAADLLVNLARDAETAIGITAPDIAMVPDLFTRGFQFVVISAAKLLASAGRQVLALVDRSPESMPTAELLAPPHIRTDA
jgi:4-hydroxy-2-oxoheptanedioate aldolase